MPVVASRRWESIIELFLVACLSLCSSVAKAFTPDLHKEYATAAALIYFERCADGVIGTDKKQTMIDALAHGVSAEDGWTISRATNWHFFNRGGKVEPSWWAEHNLDRIFAARTAQLSKELARREQNLWSIYVAAGRVLHYVQDMSVPAHVVPVYHGLHVKDDFDSYIPSAAGDRTEVEASVRESLDAPCEVHLAANGNLSDQLSDMLAKTAEQTLWAIGQTSTSQPSSLRWRRYWDYNVSVPLDRSGRRGFGDYGTCGFKPSAATSEGCVSESDHRLFYQTQYRRVLEDGIKVLKLLQHAMRTRSLDRRRHLTGHDGQGAGNKPGIRPRYG